MTRRSAFLVSLLILADQASKFLVSTRLRLNESLPVIKDMFHITLVHNTGIAFGLLKGMVVIFIFASLAAVFFIILCTNRFRHGYSRLKTGLLLILAGTIGNLIDRVRLGYVVDFIDLRIWPVFNIADMAITIGGLFMVYHILRPPQPGTIT